MAFQELIEIAVDAMQPPCSGFTPSASKFSGNAVSNIKESAIDELVVTDSIPLSEEMKATGKVHQLTLSGMLSEALRRVSNEESISAMFDY